MRDTAVSLAQDPASTRLAPEQVMYIHKQHMAGVGWQEIAEEVGIARKNVQRIVQGRRHADLHPQNAPHLYSEGTANPVRATLTIYLDTPAGKAAKVVYDTLSKD